MHQSDDRQKLLRELMEDKRRGLGDRKLAAVVFDNGYRYEWNGANWAFVAPR